jgi:hypothetical protein
MELFLPQFSLPNDGSQEFHVNISGALALLLASAGKYQW